MGTMDLLVGSSGFTESQKPRMVAAFAILIRRGEHSHARYTEPLVTGTVSKALSELATTFTNNDKPDPRPNCDNKTHRHISSILTSFKRSGPKEKAQKAITPELLRQLYKQKQNSFSSHVADLCNGAFFFACRSCECSSTTGTRKSKIITVENVNFFIKNRQITKRDEFHIADSVSITFISQRNDKSFETVTQHKNSSTLQNPVIVWANIINRVLNLEDTNKKSPINTFFNPVHKRNELVTSDQILKSLRWAAGKLGKDILGYTKEEIGCHLIQSGAAMAMYLAKYPRTVPTYTIML